MKQNLMETYARQLKIAEGYVQKTYDKAISDNTKLATAVLLDNTNRWITESINSVGSTRADLGDWKKFCLNLTNLAVPSLIANDLVIVHPMTSYSGSVAYLSYVAKSNKGGINQGDVFNSVFGMGDPNIDVEARMNYTSQAVVENVTSFTSGTTKVAWTPVAKKFKEFGIGEDEYDIRFLDADGAELTATGVSVAADGTVTATIASGTVAKIAYKYNQEHVPARDIPTIGPKIERIALVCESRRIAVRYDQITAFQAKTDYGFSLDKQIAEQACGELAYEIDTEIVDMLYKNSGNYDSQLVWSKALPVGVSKFEHYNGFLEVVEAARTIIYKRTRKFHPNYMVVAANCLPVLRFVNGFTPVKTAKMNGPYKVGELDNMSVYVSPNLKDGDFFFGLNGNDMMSSAGVYAPYMAIVPTQLLGTPDGALSQGFSTWYAKAILNSNLLVKGKITD